MIVDIVYSVLKLYDLCMLQILSSHNTFIKYVNKLFTINFVFELNE